LQNHVPPPHVSDVVRQHKTLYCFYVTYYLAPLNGMQWICI
jgi:hypothetical protein